MADNSTGTCFIQKRYALSSSLLQGKHLPHFALIFFAYLCIRFNDLKIKQATFAEYFCPIRLRGPGISI